MADAETIWQRFIVCKLQPQSLNSGTQSIDNTQSSVLGARSINLSSGSIALHADADTAALMRDLAVRPVAELLSEKASRELASRSRYVDFVRLAFSCCVNDASGRAKKAELAIKSIEVRLFVHVEGTINRPLLLVGAVRLIAVLRAGCSFLATCELRNIYPASSMIRYTTQVCRLRKF